MYYGIVKPCPRCCVGCWSDRPGIVCRVRPFHDINVWGGRLNNLNEIQQAHFGHYYNVYHHHQKIMSHILIKELT
jgi:uncharacterized protein YcbX